MTVALTASRLPLAAECTHPFREGTATSDEAGVAALSGTAFHGRVHASLAELPAPVPVPGADDEAVDAMFDAWRAWWPTFRGSLWWHAEVPVAFDLETGDGRFLPSSGHRDYSAARASEIPGTTDVFALEREHDALHVIDWKTGHPDYLDPADDSKQLVALALGLARNPEIAPVRVVFVYMVHVAPDGVRVDRATLEDLDLDAAEADLRDIVAGIADERAPRPGPHCRYCPARAGCPETERSLVPFVEETPASAIASILRGEELTVERIALAHRALPMIEELAKKARDRIKEHARSLGGRIPLGNGKALKLIPMRREGLSMDSINTALGEADAHVVLERLRAAGAFTQSVYEQLREVKA